MDIFVFGSNLAGRHGKGAAKYAYDYYGAVYGIGSGAQGFAYAIPTKDLQLKTLPLDIIKGYVDEFIAFATIRPAQRFIVTRIGCGLAGYRDSDIVPMFHDAPPNCALPTEWLDIL